MRDKLHRCIIMFTASVFKDLLLSVFSELKENFIILPLKKTTECDFTNELKILISNCGMDPSIFSSSIISLNKNREEVALVSSITKHFQYFIELENITMRLSPKNLSHLHFTW